MIRYKIVVPYATKNTTVTYKYYYWSGDYGKKIRRKRVSM